MLIKLLLFHIIYPYPAGLEVCVCELIILYDIEEGGEEDEVTDSEYSEFTLNPISEYSYVNIVHPVRK